MIYKTLYGTPLDFSKIYDIVMNNEMKLTYLLFSVYLSVLCSLGVFRAILSNLSSNYCLQMHVIISAIRFDEKSPILASLSLSSLEKS